MRNLAWKWLISNRIQDWSKSQWILRNRKEVGSTNLKIFCRSKFTMERLDRESLNFVDGLKIPSSCQKTPRFSHVEFPLSTPQCRPLFNTTRRFPLIWRSWASRWTPSRATSRVVLLVAASWVPSTSTFNMRRARPTIVRLNRSTRRMLPIYRSSITYWRTLGRYSLGKGARVIIQWRARVTRRSERNWCNS